MGSAISVAGGLGGRRVGGGGYGPGVALALYRKYRPATFAEVVGQEHVTEPLRTALSAKRVLTSDASLMETANVLVVLGAVVLCVRARSRCGFNRAGYGM